MATDLRTPKYGRNAKETFSLAVNLSTFSTYLSFFSFPRWFDTNNNWDLHCMRSATDQSARGLFQLHAVINSPKRYSFIKWETLTWTNLPRLTRLAFLGLTKRRTVHATERRGWVGTVPHTWLHTATTWFGAQRPSGPRTIISIYWFNYKTGHIWKCILRNNIILGCIEVCKTHHSHFLETRINWSITEAFTSTLWRIINR